jgi:hypothetical protein
MEGSYRANVIVTLLGGTYGQEGKIIDGQESQKSSERRSEKS